MPTSYTTLLGLALPVTGELSGTWGDVVSNYITQYLDSAVAGTQTISGSQTAVTLSVTNGSSLVTAGSGATGSAQFQIINCTGNPAGLLTITAPASSRQYIIINATSTSQSVKIVGTGPTTGVTLIAGEKAHVAWNGSDFVKIATTAAAGGSNTQVQYNSSGVLAGSSNMTFDGTNLTVGGTASATKLIPTGGAITGNGMYLPAANSVAITTNGAQAIYIDSSQNVGIGTSSPGQLLTLSKATTPAMSFVRGTGTATIGVDNGGSIAVGASAGDFIIRGTGTTGNTIIASSSGVINAFFSELGNLGLGVTPSAWGTGAPWRAIDIQGGSLFSNGTLNSGMGMNWYNNGTNYIYKATGPALEYEQAFDGTHRWYNATSGTAGNTISFTQAMTLDANGNLGVGITAPSTSTSNARGLVVGGGVDGQIRIQTTNTGTTSSDGLLLSLDSSANAIAYIWNYENASMLFGTNNTERMRLDSSGNLGLGVTPSNWGANYRAFTVGNSGEYVTVWGSSNTDGGANSYGQAAIGNNITQSSKYAGTGTASYYVQSGGRHSWWYSASGTAGNSITGWTQAMTLDASGNLLLGTTTTTNNFRLNQSLAVVKAGSNTYAGMGITGYAGTTGGARPILDFNRSRGTTDGSMTVLANGDYLGSIIFRGSDGTSFQDSAMISAEVDGTPGASDMPGRLTFWTSSDGSASVTERARITSGGDLYVGQTTGGLQAARSFSWQGAGDGSFYISHSTANASGDPYIRFGYNATQIGTITQNGTTAVAYNTSSDYRLKENIQPMTGALAKVAALKPCTYKWKADGSDGEGFIAHELAEVAPQCVTGEKDAVDAEGKPVYQGIDTSFLVATLTAAIQEQQTIIQSLTARIAALESKGA